jgi:hypothetical protein
MTSPADVANQAVNQHSRAGKAMSETVLLLFGIRTNRLRASCHPTRSERMPRKPSASRRHLRRYRLRSFFLAACPIPDNSANDHNAGRRDPIGRAQNA